MKPNCRHLILFVSALCIFGLLSACGTMKNGRGWGQDATVFPGWYRVGKAALDAATAPETWVPIAGAAILQIDHMDKRLSDYATSNTPIFGSKDAAGYAGHVFKEASQWAYYATVVAAPSGDTLKDWSISKIKGLAVGGAAIASTSAATGFLKDTVKRTRPDRADNKSFPSSTTSRSSVNTTLASRNLDAFPFDDAGRTALRIGLFTLTAATGWARVEEGGHFPSDVLVGGAIGHFFGVFFNNAFLGLNNDQDVITLEVEPSRYGAMVRIQWPF